MRVAYNDWDDSVGLRQLNKYSHARTHTHTHTNTHTHTHTYTQRERERGFRNKYH